MITFRPAVRQDTPLIVGLAGPTKSGKTLSAHRLAAGIANGGVVAMINAEGARGHQYADKFTYVAHDIEPPFSPKRYTEAVLAAKTLNPSVLIIDSMSHMHDGPGGLLEYHDAELDRMAGTDDFKKRERMTWTAWIRPKADENEFIYALLGLKCPVVLCFRAKEKLKILAGKPPIDLGWQPIASDRISFETLFTLVLPPHCKGVPDLSISEMREPFDTMIPEKQLDEELGRKLAQWAAGGAKPSAPAAPSLADARGQTPAVVPSGADLVPNSDLDLGDQPPSQCLTVDQVIFLTDRCREHAINTDALSKAAGVRGVGFILQANYDRANQWIDKQIDSRSRKKA